MTANTHLVTTAYTPLGTLVVPAGETITTAAQPCVSVAELEAWRRKGFDLSHIRVTLLVRSTQRLGIVSASLGDDDRGWSAHPKVELYGEEYTIATGPEYPPDTPVRFLLSAGVDTLVGLGATVWLYAHAKPSGLPG